MSRKNKEKRHSESTQKRWDAKNSRRDCPCETQNDLEEYICEMPVRCFWFSILFWSFSLIFAISMIRMAYFIPLSLSDSNVIRFGTNAQDYIIGETSSLQNKRNLQREIVSQIGLMWFAIVTIMPFVISSILINVLKIFRTPDERIYLFSSVLCLRSKSFKRVIPTIYGFTLSVFGILITVFSLWSGAL